MGRTPSEDPRNKRLVFYVTAAEATLFREMCKKKFPRLSMSDAVREIVMGWTEATVSRKAPGGGSGGLGGGEEEAGRTIEGKEEPPFRHHSGITIAESSSIIDRRPRASRKRGVL